MYESGFLEAVEIPEAAIRNVRADLEQVPEIVRTNATKNAAFNPSIIIPAQETHFRIEVVADLRVAESHRPVRIVIVRASGERIVSAGQSGRFRLRRPALQQQVVADTPAAIYRIGLVLVITPVAAPINNQESNG